MRIAVYPGSFDPVTLGHMDVLKRASTIFDKVIVSLAKNVSKQCLFSMEERIELISENIKDMPNVELKIMEGLTVDFAKRHNACALIRGLRAISDFEYEFQLAQMNRHLSEDIETIFLMPSHLYFFTSSSLIKQVSHFDADRVKDFVPANVLEALLKKRF